MVPLEQLFDINDIPVKPVILPKDENIEDCNIGTEHEPKYIKLSKYIYVEKKQEYQQIFKEYMDVFAWKYEDLKTYDTNIIQHMIPLKLGSKPFRKKLRKVNPIFLPTIDMDYWRTMKLDGLLKLGNPSDK